MKDLRPMENSIGIGPTLEQWMTKLMSEDGSHFCILALYCHTKKIIGKKVLGVSLTSPACLRCLSDELVNKLCEYVAAP